MSKKAENQEKEIASEAFLPSLSHEYMGLFRELLEHLERALPINRVEIIQNEIQTVNDDERSMCFGYVLKETGELIGSGSVDFHEDEGNRWSIGYNLSYDAWGKGYATEAISKIIEYARSRFDIKEIYGTFAVENNGSRRVMEKLGMTFFEDCEYSKFDGSRTYKAKTYRKEF